MANRDAPNQIPLAQRSLAVAHPPEDRTAYWEHFPHGADVGIRGVGGTMAEAFAQVAAALTSAVCDLESVEPLSVSEIACRAPNAELLLVDWINAIVFLMATERKIFREFDVRIDDADLYALVKGEPIDPVRHEPAVEVKGATHTLLRVAQLPDGGLGHQIGSDFLRQMAIEAPQHGLTLPDRELACAPINSSTGQAYLGAMRAGINCALANRQMLAHLVRQAFARIMPEASLSLLYDVSHNTCKVESHTVNGHTKRLFVHRKGATRAFGPGHSDLPADFAAVGQPVLIGGTMGTASYVLVGTREGLTRSLGSSCHGAGRSMSRHQALRQFRGRQIVDDLAARGIIVRSPSSRGVAEEAPGAYKDVTAVVDAADRAGLSRKVARLEPIVCIKG